MLVVRLIKTKRDVKIECLMDLQPRFISFRRRKWVNLYLSQTVVTARCGGRRETRNLSDLFSKITSPKTKVGYEIYSSFANLEEKEENLCGFDARKLETNREEDKEKNCVENEENK